MEDRAKDSSAAAERFRRLLEGSRHRWHPAPDDGLLFVLDDGTGDVELRLLPEDADTFQTVLTRRDLETARLAVSTTGDDEAAVFLSELDEAVERGAPGLASDGGKGKTRFIVSFEATQLAGLRETADRDRVPVAEVVRRAVAEYLAARGGAPAEPGA